MKKYKFLSVISLFLTAAILFAGCSLFGKKTAVETNAGVLQNSSSGAAASSKSAGSSNIESQNSGSSSSGSSQNARIPESGSEPGPVKTIQTENEKFNKKFKDNPIDKKYIKEMNDAISNIDMVDVSDKYSEVWQKEIDYAYGELEKYMKADSSKKPAAYKAEQEKWKQGKESSLKKISSDAISAGGSMAQVDEASAAMDFYRARAAAVYSELYTYNKNYTYKFSS